MRGFTETKQMQNPVLGEAFYQYAIKQAKREDSRTVTARKIFHTPPYCFGERRKEYERRIHEQDSESLKHRLEEIQRMGIDEASFKG
jgi:hypothetical protein